MNAIRPLPPTVFLHFISAQRSVPDSMWNPTVPEFDDEASRGSQSVAEIATLSTARIMEMTCGDLADVIRKVRMRHLRPGVLEQLSRMDGTTLRRLVFATRRYCRSQMLLLEESVAPMGHCPR